MSWIIASLQYKQLPKFKHCWLLHTRKSWMASFDILTFLHLSLVKKIQCF